MWYCIIIGGAFAIHPFLGIIAILWALGCVSNKG